VRKDEKVFSCLLCGWGYNEFRFAVLTSFYDARIVNLVSDVFIYF